MSVPSVLAKGCAMDGSRSHIRRHAAMPPGQSPAMESPMGNMTCLGQAVHLQNYPGSHSASSTRSGSSKSNHVMINMKMPFQAAYRYSLPVGSRGTLQNCSNATLDASSLSAMPCTTRGVGRTYSEDEVDQIRAGISQMICANRLPSEEKISEQRLENSEEMAASQDSSCHSSGEDSDQEGYAVEEGCSAQEVTHKELPLSESTSQISVVKQWKRKKKKRKKRHRGSQRLSIHRLVRQSGSPVKLQPLQATSVPSSVLNNSSKQTTLTYTTKDYSTSATSNDQMVVISQNLSAPKMPASPRKLAESLQISCPLPRSLSQVSRQQAPTLQRTTKIFLSERQSNTMQELGQQFPCPPPCTPKPDMLIGVEFVTSMSDIRAQRTVRQRLEVLERVQQQQRQKQREHQQQQLRVQQQQEMEQNKQRQREEIYALNKIMTQLENTNFQAFIKENGLNTAKQSKDG